MNHEKLRKEMYEAFMQAAEETGGAYKDLSWFGKNKNRDTPAIATMPEVD